MPHLTRRAVPPCLARHPGRRGTRFVGEAGSPGKAGSPRNRARRGTGIKVKNVRKYVRKLVGLLWHTHGQRNKRGRAIGTGYPHIQAYGRLYIRVYGRPLYPKLCACNEYTPLSAVSSSRSSAYISPVLATGIG